MENTNIIKIADYTNYETIRCNSKSFIFKALDKNGNKVLLKSFIKSDDNEFYFVNDSRTNKLIPVELYFLRRQTGEQYVPKLLEYHDEENCATVVMEFLDNE